MFNHFFIYNTGSIGNLCCCPLSQYNPEQILSSVESHCLSFGVFPHVTPHTLLQISFFYVKDLSVSPVHTSLNNAFLQVNDYFEEPASVVLTSEYSAVSENVYQSYQFGLLDEETAMSICNFYLYYAQILEQIIRQHEQGILYEKA